MSNTALCFLKQCDMRNWFVFGALMLFIILSFLVWGEGFTQLFGEEKVVSVLAQYGNWAWLFGIILLIGDLFLPLPSTIIMSALGFLYGPLLGGILATIGNFLSGMLAYVLCHLLSKRFVLKILGAKDYQKGKLLFNTRGGWIVAISRWLPILPEAIAFMAGLNRMNARRFAISLLCGSLPLGFVFAFIGHTGINQPCFAIAISAILPFFLWLIAQRQLRKVMVTE